MEARVREGGALWKGFFGHLSNLKLDIFAFTQPYLGSSPS